MAWRAKREKPWQPQDTSRLRSYQRIHPGSKSYTKPNQSLNHWKAGKFWQVGKKWKNSKLTRIAESHTEIGKVWRGEKAKWLYMSGWFLHVSEFIVWVFFPPTGPISNQKPPPMFGECSFHFMSVWGTCNMAHFHGDRAGTTTKLMDSLDDWIWASATKRNPNLCY